MDTEALKLLHQKLLSGDCTKEELQVLLDHFTEKGADSPLMEQILMELEKEGPAESATQYKTDRVIAGADKHLASIWKNKSTIKRKTFFYYSIAAAISLLLCTGAFLYWYSNVDNPQDTSLASKYGEDVSPGGNKALLTFADGSTVDLNEDKEGVIFKANNLTYEDGTAIENIKPGITEGNLAVQYVTLSTPRGGQYKVVLSDGTIVWLNAASSLYYPPIFSGKERKVLLTGEGYFEVSHNQTQPFIVESKGQSVQVLGTAFNISAYEDELMVRTTLVNGSIMLRQAASGKKQNLSPGQQAILSDKSFGVETVDVAEYYAWKEGYFQFDGMDLKNVMRQLERWYDIEVDYSDIPARKLHAKIKRSRNISAVLSAIENTSGISFIIKERRLTIQE